MRRRYSDELGLSLGAYHIMFGLTVTNYVDVTLKLQLKSELEPKVMPSWKALSIVKVNAKSNVVLNEFAPKSDLAMVQANAE